jgi:hypothetical protein
VASLDPPADDRVGIIDLYRATWAAARDAFVRYHAAIAIELGMIAVWVLIRTLFGVETRLYLLWTIVAILITFVSPASGLVILVGTAPFFEPVTVSRVLGMRHFLVAALGVSVALRLVAGGWRRMPWSAPVVLAIIIAGLTALGVANTVARFPADWAWHAAHSWVATIGGAMVILVVAVWGARDGTWRPVAVAIVAAVVAGVASLIEHFVPGAVSLGPLTWIGFWKDFHGRLGGLIASPNAMAALLIVPTSVLVFWVLRGRRAVWTRVAALVAAGAMLVCLYVTYSRAALLAVFLLAVLVAWRTRRVLGAGLAVVGIVTGAVLLPGYLQLRSESAPEGAVTPGSIIVASDLQRFHAWDAAARMWLDEPVTGQGFLAYKQLADAYGDPVLSSPHNEWLRLFAEEGVLAGVAGLAFVASILWRLARRRDAVASGILAGAMGYFLMASFNNPFLFVSVSAVAFSMIGFGLAQAHNPEAEVEPATA